MCNDSYIDRTDGEALLPPHFPSPNKPFSGLSTLATCPLRTIHLFKIRSSTAWDELYPLYFFFLPSRRVSRLWTGGWAGVSIDPKWQVLPRPGAWRRGLAKLDREGPATSQLGKGRNQTLWPEAASKVKSVFAIYCHIISLSEKTICICFVCLRKKETFGWQKIEIEKRLELL